MAIRTKRLFAIPIKKMRLPETNAIKQRFLPDMLQRYKDKRYEKPSIWRTDRIHTSHGANDSLDHSIISMPDAYGRFLHDVISSGKCNILLWHNIYWTGEEYQERHHHVPHHLSLIHFLAFDKLQHRPPVFHDPARAIKAWCRHEDVPTEYWQDKVTIDIDEGDILVFPSYLEHNVPPGKYDKPRVTVSMNVTYLDG